MISSTRKIILRANALYLGIASVAAFLLLDLRGIVFGAGAHPVRYAHLTAGVVMSLLGVCNLVFWPLFPATGMTAAGVGLTALHLLFAVAQFVAASGPRAHAAV